MASKRDREADFKAKHKLRRWRLDPVAFVMEVFGAVPDEWQADVLRLLTTCPRVAMMACKGPGKSCLMAWAAWWMLTCHVDFNGIVLSITGDNLRDGLWKEMAKWHGRSALLSMAFEVKGTRITGRERPKTWWLSARTFPQRANKDEQASTLAGLHGKFVGIILDEIGEYPSGVLPAAEGIFANADEGGQKWLLAGGNPTTRKGPLYSICTTGGAMWKVISITFP